MNKLEMNKSDVGVFNRLRPFVSREERRYVLNFVMFDGRRAYATDGKKIVIIKHESVPMAVMGYQKKTNPHPFRTCIPVVDREVGDLGIYPNIDKIIPSFSKEAHFNLKEWTEEIEAMEPFKLRSADNPDFHAVLVKVHAMEVLLQKSFLLCCLKALRGQEVDVKYEDDTRPLHIVSGDDQAILMPLRK